MVDRLIHLDECAGLMGVSLSKAYRLAKAQKAPFENIQKYGSTYMVPYLAFCERLGIQPEPQSEARAGEVAFNARKKQNAREGCGDLGG